MKKLKKKSRSTNALEINPNDQHYKRYFNSIYGDEGNKNSNPSSKKNSLSFQQVKAFKEDDNNHKLTWRRLQLSRSKLKQTAKTSALFAGFGMMSIVECQFNNDPDNPVPPNLLIVFGTCTILLVSIHLLALMISTCILPSVECIALLDNAESANESPHERLRFFIEIAWLFSSVIGVFLFLAEVLILVWVKFWELGQPLGKPGKQAALASTIVFLPFVLIFFFFAFYFYRDYATHHHEKSTKQIEELESIIVRLEQNDMTYCQNMTCNNLNCFSSSNLNNNYINYKEGKYIANKDSSRYQSHINNHDKSSLILKNLCTYSSSNDHLLNENMRSISVDQIDKDDFKNDSKNEFNLNDLYRSKFCRTACGIGNTSGDRVRFSLNNVNLNTYNNGTYNSGIQSGIHKTLQNYPFSNVNEYNFRKSKKKTQNEACCLTAKTKVISKKKPKLITATKSDSSKSTKFKGNITINDQQSNDSNKILKKEVVEDEESFNNLSATIV